MLAVPVGAAEPRGAAIVTTLSQSADGLVTREVYEEKLVPASPELGPERLWSMRELDAPHPPGPGPSRRAAGRDTLGFLTWPGKSQAASPSFLDQ